MDTIQINCEICGEKMDWLPNAGEDKICDDCRENPQLIENFEEGNYADHLEEIKKD
jgi:hypothetical protein